jgi:DNA end-binding protein Ku
MAARPTWKGTLKLSLVAIPIRVFPATQAADVSFRLLHRKCRTPIQMKRWCPHCEQDVAPADVVKAYEKSKDNFVLVEEEEIEKLRPESTKIIDISHVVNAATVDPIYIERSYYLAPDSKSAGEPFAVFRKALEEKAGVGRLALHGREYLVAVLPRGEALLMYTLRTKGEVRAATSVDGLEFADVKVKPDEVKLARQVLNSLQTEADLTAFTDRYEEALREMLEAKAPTEVPAERAGARKPEKIVNLMDALRQSLDRVSRAKKHPARAQKARVLRHTANRKARKAS